MSQKNKLLLVEDQVVVAMHEIQELEEYGYTVDHAMDAEEALIALKSDPSGFDLILMDVDLGDGRNGADLAKEILSTWSIPIVFLSTYSEQQIVKQTDDIEAYGYVLKSAGIKVLDATIKMALHLFESSMKLKYSEEKFMAAFMLNPAAMSINDVENESRIIECNKAFEVITGYSKKEVLGKTAEELGFFGDESQLEVLKSMDPFKELNEFPHVFRNRKGETFNTFLSTRNISIEGRPYTIVCQSGIYT